MRADGRLLRVDTFQKLDRYKEHDIEVVVADLKGKAPKETSAALTLALTSRQGCVLPSHADRRRALVVLHDAHRHRDRRILP